MANAGGCLIQPDVNGLVNVPSNYSSLGNYSFYDCKALVSVVIPYSVKSIGTGAFLKCVNLATASYYYGTFVGAHAFDQSGYPLGHGTVVTAIGTINRSYCC